MWSSEHLSSRLHQLQQIRPGLVHPILPFSDGGCIRMTVIYELINHLVDSCDPLLPQAPGLRCKLGKFLLQNLRIRIWLLTNHGSSTSKSYSWSCFGATDRDMLEVLSEFSGAGDDLPLCYPLLKFIHLPVELIEPVLLLQTRLPLLRQVLQRHVQPVDLRLMLTDLLTEAQAHTHTHMLVFKVYGDFP